LDKFVFVLDSFIVSVVEINCPLESLVLRDLDIDFFLEIAY